MKTFWYRLTRAVKLSPFLFGTVTLSPSAWAQAVSLTDLEGAVIDISAVHQEKIVRNGQLRSPELHTTGHLTIAAGGAVTAQFQSTAVGPRGTRVGATRSGTHVIGQPGKDSQGNDTVWVFSNGTLTRLKVHHAGGEGGQKVTIAFRRGPDGLHCSFSMPFARETGGAGEIRKDAAVDGAPIQILEFRPVSSSCSVAKR
jgi:hypothetical protein